MIHNLILNLILNLKPNHHQSCSLFCCFFLDIYTHTNMPEDNIFLFILITQFIETNEIQLYDELSFGVFLP